MKHTVRDSKPLTVSRLLSSLNRIYSHFEHATIKHPLLTPVILALSLNLIIEMLGRRSVIDGFAHLFLHPYIFFINALILFVTLMSAFLFARRAFVYCCVSVCWLILGITNFVLLGMRNTPLAAIDFGLIVSCLGIINIYLNLFQMILIGLGICLILLGLIRLFRRTQKLPVTRAVLLRRISAVAASVVGFSLVLGFSLHINAFTTKFPDLSAAYQDYGFAYCFSLSVLDRGVDRPVDYSDAEIIEILDDIGADSDTAITDQNTAPLDNTILPNVIFVQLESFFDVKRLSDISFSEDPTPVFTALKDKFPSGYLTVPAIGGGTANTEFEVLSGMNLDDFGAGEYPYKTILRDTTCESLAYNLAARDYSTHALHNNTGTFYERHKVYSMLGFDTFVPLEHMTDVTENPLGWAKDAVLTGEIRACLDSTDGQDFIFAVSVQPHGKYPDDLLSDTDSAAGAYDLPSILDRLFDDETNETASQNSTDIPRISVLGIEDHSLLAQYTYYVNQLYETDAFLGALIADLSASDEPSVLVLYGAHLPCFDYTADDMADSSTPYQTEYVIWSNFDLSAKDRDLHAYQLSAYVQSCIGTDEGILTCLHQMYLVNPDPAAAYTDYSASLAMLEYDMLYGEREVWNGMSPYLPTDLQYGIHPVRIHSVRTIGTSLYVTGEHFTPYSKVSIGDFPTETIFIDGNTLMLPDASLNDGDRITVIQSGADSIPLGESNTYIYDDRID